MHNQPLIVLKFGGSVLLDEHRLRIAVHEIHRWRRDGWRVLAVVSALSGRTDELIGRCSLLHAGASDTTRAGLIASGEFESAALLGIHLDRAGITSCVLSPASVSLVADGDPLDANPIAINDSIIDQALKTDGVVVFPGFVGVNDRAQTVTFGRGGSDLTALFLASVLGADRCRLIKDVDGLYEHDPSSRSAPPPRRYEHASYAEALATDGSIIQHKAIRFAQSHSLRFEVGRFNGTKPTTIGDGSAVFSEHADTPRVLSVVLCGLGTVGGGVLELINQLPELFSITGLACRDPSKHPALAERVAISDDAERLARSGADVVVESIGGIDPALTIAVSALESGSHFVSANKRLIAEEGTRIDRAAQASDRRVMYSASVGGVTPLLELVRGRSVRSVIGVLNGTGNFVLNAIAQGESLEHSIRKAQELGFAEADPSRDLDGRDALDKLLVIAHTLGWSIPSNARTHEEITGRSAESAIVRHIARVSADAASVRVEQVERAGVFHQLHNEWNAAMISLNDGSSLIAKGKGAGRWPTSESVLGDLLELSRSASEVCAGKEEIANV